MDSEWKEAGYCVMGSFVGFMLFIVPKIMGGLL